jgi:hypothetical protein
MVVVGVQMYDGDVMVLGRGVQFAAQRFVAPDQTVRAIGLQPQKMMQEKG